MANITLQGKPVKTIGTLPAIGNQAPDFTVTKTDLSDIHLKDFMGKNVILSFFPSIDTATCATAMRHFNESANQLDNTVILCISADLPFALSRFCAAENLNNVIPASVFRSPELGKNYGITIIDGPLTGLLSRAIVILDTKGKIIYTEQVPDIAQEPNYQAAIGALR